MNYEVVDASLGLTYAEVQEVDSATNLVSTDSTGQVTCYYENQTGKLQVARVNSVSGPPFERVVFPEQRLLFHAPPEAYLKIYSGESGTPVQIQQIACAQIQCI
ncbi:MAG: DUF1830 domain-containing protein [Leptolyngbyaceae cyanobacterium]